MSRIGLPDNTKLIARERSKFLRMWTFMFGVILGLSATSLMFPFLKTGFWVFWVAWIVFLAIELAIAYGSALVAWALFAKPIIQRKVEAGGFDE